MLFTKGSRMDFRKVITDLFGLQEVTLDDVKLFKKDLRVEVYIRKNRSESYCEDCDRTSIAEVS